MATETKELIFGIVAIVFLTIVGVWSLETAMQREDQVNRIESQHAQQMMTEACR